MDKWNDYTLQTKGRSPRPLLVRAVSFCRNRERALDLGAGALNEANYLATLGFQVTAIDSKDISREPERGVDVLIMPMELYDYPVDTFDIVSAQFSLPFIKQEDVDAVVSRIQLSLRRDGIFVGQFFGLNDSWAGVCSVHTKADVEKLFSQMEILGLKEEEYDGITILGKSRHHHIIHIITRKR